MSFHFLIIEDDVFISEHLKSIILDEGHLVSDICSNESSAITALSNQQPDLAFVDIRLQGNDSGVEIAKKLTELNIPFYFITSFADKKTVQEAVETQPKGYILKPFETDEIIDAIKKLSSFVGKQITIKVNGIELFLKVSDILYLKSENVYVEIYTAEKKYVVRDKLGDLIDAIGLQNFVQIHRSYALNLERVNKRKRRSLFIESIEIPISKKYEEEVETFFSNR